MLVVYRFVLAGARFLWERCRSDFVFREKFLHCGGGAKAAVNEDSERHKEHMTTAMARSRSLAFREGAECIIALCCAVFSTFVVRNESRE